MSNAHPAGWYPDGHGAQRWWDGTQWTQSTQPSPSAMATLAPYQAVGQSPYQAGGIPRAPEGTSPDTPHIWGIVGIFVLLSIVGLAYSASTMDMSTYMDAAMDPSDPFATYSYIFTPAYVALLLASVLGYAGTVLLAYFDGVALRDRGVERPFHWAFAFIPSYGSLVYVIGRSVVARRRTGTGLAPLWVFAAVFVLGIILTIAISIASMASVFNDVGYY